MKSEWKKLKIGDVCTIKHGYAFKGVHFCDEKTEHIVTTPGNFAISGGFKLDKTKYYRGPIPQDYILSPGDIIVTMTDLSKDGDTLGYAAIVPESNDALFLHNQRIGLIENISDSIDKGFLYWLMRTYHYQKYIVNHASGSTVKHTSPSSIASYSFQAPPLPIQRKIASILSALDEKIETNNAICRNLEEQAKCIFKNKYRAGSDFSQGTIGDVVTLQRGYDLPKSKMTKGPYPVVGSTDIIAYHNEYNCDELCIVMGRSGNVGRPRFYIEKIWAHNTSLFSKSFHSAEPVWVYYALSDIDFSLLMGGSAVPTLNRNHVHMQFLNIAPLHKQREFANEVMPLIWMIFAKEKENRGLATFRDNLLPKLMSGELAVENIN